MPAKKKKKFIEKKNAVTFHLVHRSQRDPLQADDDAPKRVLVEPTNSEKKAVNRKEEQKKFGIYYEDDYDYMQHLRDVNELSEVEPVVAFRIERKEKQKPEESQIVLPSSVFGSEVETNIGLLNKAVPLRGPQLDWDPDIVAALDDDFDYSDPENQLEDDFISIAMGNEEYSGKKLGRLRADFSDDDNGSDEAELSSEFGSDDGRMFMEEETKSRFTNYSMTSSVIRRNEGLTLVDDMFEKLYEQYDEEEIGALDHEEIRGFLGQNSELVNDALEEFEKNQIQIKLKDAIQPGEVVLQESDSESDDSIIEMVVEEPQDKWDCESILSTYSNLYNHPKLIEEPRKCNPIKLTKRVAIPADVLPQRGPTQKQIEKTLYHYDSNEKTPSFRPKEETKEEKKFRKKMVKDVRKARREEKKANKDAFKEEKKRQEKLIINVQRTMTGIKIQ